MSRIPRSLVFALVAVIALFGVTTAGVFGQSSDVFYACAKDVGNKSLSQFSVNEEPKCKKNETLVSWTSGGGAPSGNYIEHGETDSITSEMIVDQTVMQGDLAPGSVGSDQLQENSVGPVQLQDFSVAGQHLVDASVTQQKLQPNSVGNDQLQNGSVTTNKLFSNAARGIGGNVVLGATYVEVASVVLTNPDINPHIATVNAVAQVNCAGECTVQYRLAGGLSLAYSASGNGPMVITAQSLTLLSQNSVQSFVLEARVISGSATASAGDIVAVDLGLN